MAIQESAGPRLAVTGVTGRVGGGVARRLSAAGVAHRMIARDPSRAPRLDGATMARADYGDPAAGRAALEGIDTVFMVSGSEAAERVAQHRTFVDAAVAAGVSHVVYLSFYGAGPDATFTLVRDHWATEEHIRASGLTYTFVRDNLYLDFFVELAATYGRLQGPAGNGRVAAVAIDDIADAVAAILRDPAAHRGMTYSLTGPEAWTLHDLADELCEATGRPVTYDEETVEEAYASRAQYEAPEWQVDAWVSTYTAIAAGELSEPTADVERLAGHPPRRIADLAGRGD